MASLPLDANVLLMTVMATNMSLVGRGRGVCDAYLLLVIQVLIERVVSVNDVKSWLLSSSGVSQREGHMSHVAQVASNLFSENF
jgi:hypothetical protein